jgi:hypothetical protein
MTAGQASKSQKKPAAARLENVAEAGYSGSTQGFAMQAARRTTKALRREAAWRRLWRWPLAFGLALAVAVSLFHDLPALAGTGGADPTPVVFAASAPVEAPGDSQAPAAGCHCLCHMASQAIGTPIVTPVVFNESLLPPRGSVPPRSCAGLPPFRPPRA